MSNNLESNNPESNILKSKKMSQNNEDQINHNAKAIIFRSMDLILHNLKENMEHVARQKYFNYTQKFIDAAYDGLKNKRRFFLLASGRSGMILQCFATRLVHLGAEVYMITNLASLPPLRRKDILIVLSGSGTTTIVVSLLETYVNTIKPFKIITITSHPDTVIGRIGDITIKLVGRTKKDNDIASADTAILTPEGTQFEIAAFVYLDAIIAELTNQGKSIEDARKGGASDCVESGAFGKEAYILTGYFNMVKILEITLNNGIDPSTGKQIGLSLKASTSV